MCGSCLKCIGCCCCLLFLLLLALALVASYYYALYVPQVPTYEVERLDVRALDLRPDLTLDAAVLATVRASNPNANIGFLYGDKGRVDVVFNDTDVLCTGRPPHFRQGHRNVTKIRVDMAGSNRVGPGLQAALEENRKSHRPVPLVVKVEMPIRVVVEGVPLREFTVYLNSSMLVDNLAPNKTMTIISSETSYYFEL
ncbi:NDR1/HIN1-like protein 6 [Salvia miltiorrhiza]|uniref:NDR1/HIN1-like protein 6 n=1 Tax=Salvia miltiorrhiza TaxID=226208 RepID=UPI0025AD28D5|nr:NDR1/HIN1-like protein 6 [Salvia miltiorrhiza]